MRYAAVLLVWSGVVASTICSVVVLFLDLNSTSFEVTVPLSSVHVYSGNDALHPTLVTVSSEFLRTQRPFWLRYISMLSPAISLIGLFMLWEANKSFRLSSLGPVPPASSMRDNG